MLSAPRLFATSLRTSFQHRPHAAFNASQVAVAFVDYFVYCLGVAHSVGNAYSGHVLAVWQGQFYKLTPYAAIYFRIAFAVQAQPLFNPRFQVAGRGQYYAALVLELIIQAYEKYSTWSLSLSASSSTISGDSLRFNVSTILSIMSLTVVPATVAPIFCNSFAMNVRRFQYSEQTM